MYDFAQHGIIDRSGPQGLIADFTPASLSNNMLSTNGKKGKKKVKVEEKKPEPTPKELHKLGGLNAKDFKINVDPIYIAEQIKQIDEKLEFIGKKPKVKKERGGLSWTDEVGGVTYGRMELESIRERLTNRLAIKKYQDTVDQYPHTTNTLISELLKNHKHLMFQPSGKFIPDFPKDAIDAMKEYTFMCESLCNKKPVFYVIGQHSDFQEVNKRRDPILLAQSPFGHFWQVLGAWDEEMIYLGDL